MIRIVIVAALASGCFFGPARNQRITAHVFNGAIATLGGALIAITAVDKSREPDESTLIQFHPDFYAAGSVLIGCALLGTALNIFAPEPRSHVPASVAKRVATARR